MARTISVPADGRAVSRASKRLLAVRGDDQLVEQLRGGNEAAFEVIYERHVPGVLSFCRHMLGSRDQGEDAVQHAFAAAHRDLLRDDREIRLRPWLYAIARNRCLSMLRARREQPEEALGPSTEGLDDEVQRRADLRELVADLQELPEDQRAALVLSELRGLSHADVAEALGCEVAKVKRLVFRARSGLIERRDARGASCEEVQQELATARGGGFRRGKLRHHLRSCSACSHYLEEVRAQRKMMALILPVVPTVGLKKCVLSAVGLGGGASGGGGAAAGGGLLAGVLPAAGATVAKVAVVGALVAGAGVAGKAALDSDDPPGGPPPAIAPEGARNGPRSRLGEAHSARAGDRRGAAPERRRPRARPQKPSKALEGGLAHNRPAQAPPSESAPRGDGQEEPKAVPIRERAPDPVSPQEPSPVTPEPPIRVPSPQLPSPQLPAPELPAPQLPAPELPAPQLPAPGLPAPQLPAPELPAPELPAPQLPAPGLPSP